jgi:hypothetical protein
MVIKMVQRDYEKAAIRIRRCRCYIDGGRQKQMGDPTGNVGWRQEKVGLGTIEEVQFLTMDEPVGYSVNYEILQIIWIVIHFREDLLARLCEIWCCLECFLVLCCKACCKVAGISGAATEPVYPRPLCTDEHHKRCTLQWMNLLTELFHNASSVDMPAERSKVRTWTESIHRVTEVIPSLF